jgi:hypothetical protein
MWRLSNTTLGTQVKHCSSLHFCHRMVFQAISTYLLKKQFILTLIIEIKTRNHDYIRRGDNIDKKNYIYGGETMLTKKTIYMEGRQC